MTKIKSEEFVNTLIQSTIEDKIEWKVLVSISGRYYKCILNEVVIEVYSDTLVLCGNKVTIENIEFIKKLYVEIINFVVRREEKNVQDSMSRVLYRLRTS